MEKVEVKDLAKIGGEIVKELLSNRDKWQFVSAGTDNQGARWCIFSVRDMVWIGEDLRTFELLCREEVTDKGEYSIIIDTVFEIKN